MITVGQLRAMLASLPDDALIEVKLSRIDATSAPVASGNAERCRRYRAKHVAKHVATMSPDMGGVSPPVSGSSLSSLEEEQKEPATTEESEITQTLSVSQGAPGFALAVAGDTRRDMGGMHVATPKQPTKKPGRSRRCPETWQPKDAHWKIADVRKIDLRAELVTFRDYEFASPKSDWDAVFRIWLNRARPAAASREPFLSEREKLERRLMAAASAGATAEGKTASIFGSLFTPAKDAAE